MNLLEIKTDAASYLEVGVADLTVDSQDLWLMAANRVRRQVEQGYNLEFSRALVQLEVDGVTGGSLDDAIVYGTEEETVNVKSVIEVGLFDENGNLRPVDWTTVSASLELQRKMIPGFTPRYPTDGQVLSGLCGSQRITFSNRNVFILPKQEDLTLTLGLEVYTYFANWVAADLSEEGEDNPVEDIWTENAADYLLWATIIQLNYRFKAFVPRQEGNLATPADMKAEALQRFLEWDINQYEQFRRHG